MEPTTGIPAPYGRACTGCSRAKCRCVMRVGGGCERCHRLGKECAPVELVRKRRSRKTTPAARRSQLEDKLSDLVSLLQAQHAPPPTNSVNHTGLHTTPLVSSHSANTPARDGSIYQVPYQMPTPITMASKSTAHVSPASNNEGMYTNTDSHIDAEQYLHTFRTYHLKSFPFLHLPNDMTVSEMQRERPFLWMNIQAVCTQSPAAQANLGIQIRRMLATKIIMEGERSLDLLLGLLVFTAWSFYFFRGKPMLGVNTGLIRSMVTDLRIDRPAGEKASLDDQASTFMCQKPWTLVEPNSNLNPRTNEERRALLACFVLTATLSLTTGHQPMPWGLQMDDAIVQLTKDCQCSGDEVLVAIARISKVCEDAANLMRHGSEDPESIGSALLAIKLLRGSLEQVRTLLSPEILQDKTVLSYLYCCEVMIHELALFQIPAISYCQPFDFQRFNYLHICAQAIKSSLDNFLSRDTIEFRSMNLSITLQFSHCIQVLHRLSCLQHPGWDRHLIRASADVLDYLEKSAAKMEAADESLKSDNAGEEVSIFGKGASLLRAAVPIWAAALEKADTPAVQYDGNEETEPMRHSMDDTLMEFSDEMWFTDVFASWNV
ncbi:hypothetical protein K504DRAFT_392946 [Pleomassaria siparia CBS 279.74]|uniref:Zn(2)-C6 fungal-type domain-containing protein n=1 Tax=Pleomassaria siparia CBS 279.74 TaxID=1314801 RepID=A0A6G1JRS7_9PLEO|nr:hypothetical protein K504DRAFT_392946 [Pleomassaria siparia CBS 279.74]